jgi:hypothetical protein
VPAEAEVLMSLVCDDIECDEQTSNSIVNEDNDWWWEQNDIDCDVACNASSVSTDIVDNSDVSAIAGQSQRQWGGDVVVRVVCLTLHWQLKQIHRFQDT